MKFVDGKPLIVLFSLGDFLIAVLAEKGGLWRTVRVIETLEGAEYHRPESRHLLNDDHLFEDFSKAVNYAMYLMPQARNGQIIKRTYPSAQRSLSVVTEPST